MAYVLGLDAGNSKTLALIATSEGQIVGFGRSGCGDISNREVGPELALRSVVSAVQEAIERAAIQPEDIVAQSFSMAGADWPEDFSYLKTALGNYPWGRKALIVNDALGALRATSLTGFGVAMVCGTYAVTAARSEAELSWHSSFWQETGGAYRLGCEALRAIYRAELAIDRQTSLTPLILSALDQPDVEAVLHAMTAREHSTTQSDVAKLAALVLSAADQGDDAALAIIVNQAAIMTDYAFAAARQVALEGAYALYLTGGVFHHASYVLDEAIKSHIAQTRPDIHITRSHAEPIIGALLYSLERSQVEVSHGIFDRLKGTLPTAAWFATS